jgi:thioredoxin 1
MSKKVYKKMSSEGAEQPMNFQSDYKVMAVQNREHRNELIRKNTILCIKIWADWCKPCMEIVPAYANLSYNYKKNGIANLVEEPYDSGIRTEYQIDSLPTFLIFLKGQLVRTVVGANLGDVSDIIEKIVENLNRVDKP